MWTGILGGLAAGAAQDAMLSFSYTGVDVSRSSWVVLPGAPSPFGSGIFLHKVTLGNLTCALLQWRSYPLALGHKTPIKIQNSTELYSEY
jgi:hypothetical protein